MSQSAESAVTAAAAAATACIQRRCPDGGEVVGRTRDPSGCFGSGWAFGGDVVLRARCPAAVAAGSRQQWQWQRQQQRLTEGLSYRKCLSAVVSLQGRVCSCGGCCVSRR